MRIALLSLGLSATVMMTATAAPFTPSSDADIVQKLPAGAAQKRVPKFIFKLKPSQRISYARQALNRARQSGDDIFYGYAEAALEPWPAGSAAPLEVYRLRAFIAQHHHAFDAALLDIDKLLARKPNDDDAWLLKANTLTVQGHYAAAAKSCAKISETQAQILCQLQIDSLTGRARATATTLRTLTPTLPEAYRQWAWAMLAETLVRLGDTEAANYAFEQALELDPKDVPSRIAFAWHLLDQKQARQALNIAEAALHSDGLLVVAIAAHQQLQQAELMQERSEILKRRFTLTAQRQDLPHLREQAQLAYLERRYADAFELAQGNWQQQREGLDTLILHRAAQATKQLDHDAISTANAWRKQHQQEDVRLDRAPTLRPNDEPRDEQYDEQ